jgi:hypothetical protein
VKQVETAFSLADFGNSRNGIFQSFPNSIASGRVRSRRGMPCDIYHCELPGFGYAAGGLFARIQNGRTLK